MGVRALDHVNDSLEELSKEELVVLVRALQERVPATPSAGVSDLDSKAAAAHAIERAGLLNAAMEEMPAAITVKGRDGRYLVVNAAARRLLGASGGDAVGRRIEDLVPAAVAKSIAAADARVLDGEALPPAYEQTFSPAGQPVTVRTSKTALHDPDTGAIIGVVTLSANAVDMDPDAARLSSLVRSAPFPLYFKDTDARFTIVNAAFLDLYGTTVEAAIGHTSPEALGAVGVEYMAEDQQVLETREIFRREVTLAGKQHMVVKFPVLDSHGNLLGVGGTEPSIADLKAMEEALMRAKTDAEVANRAKSQFLATMSHELRTPLNAIIGFATIMRDGLIEDLSPAQHRDYAGDIADSATLLLELINDVLDISKAEVGTMTLDRDRFDASALVARCITLAETQGNVTVPIKADLPSAPVEGYGDERRVRQVLSNLIHNARKFTDTGEITVTARLVETGALRLAVSDTGIGIDPLDLPTITEPFSRGTDAMRRRTDGAGLGLWLSAALIEAHGGTLTIKSEPGTGTTVDVVLPPQG